MLEFRMFGPFEALRNGQPITAAEWGRRKTETLLKILLTERGRVFSDDKLLESLFEVHLASGVTRSLQGNLRGRVAELRRALEPSLESGRDSQYILRLGEGYCFSSRASVWVDVEAFGAHVAEAEQASEAGRPAFAASLYEEALALFQGELLESDPYEEWALAPRERWREDRLAALLELASCYAQLGEYKKATGCCKRVLYSQPASESAIRRLMQLHYIAGEDSLAAEAFERGKQALKEHLDIDPSAETCALLKDIQEGRMQRGMDLPDPLRLAVLPFVNLCPDAEDEYFVDGVTEELIYSLSKFPELKVIAQTSVLSYKGANTSIAQVGRELLVGSIVEGSVRKANNELRITAQLIDVVSEAHIWSGEYDRELGDVFEVQTEISQEVACHLRGQLVPERRNVAKLRYVASPEAYRLFLEGRFFLRKRYGDSLQKARASFEDALEIDGNFALARASLSVTLWLLAGFRFLPFEEGIKQAKREAEAALALDKQAGEAYSALATIRALAHYDLHGAAVLHDRAVDVEPENVEIRHHRAVNLFFLGRLDVAIEAYRDALEIDPVSSRLMRSLAYCLDFARRHDEALALLQRAERLEQRDWTLSMCFGNAYLHLQQYEKASNAYALAMESDDEASHSASLDRILHAVLPILPMYR